MTQMRWQCQDYGCYLQRRTDAVMFDGCFPTGVSMGDVDGMVELNGHFLLAEFKRPGISVPAGQMSMFERLAAAGQFTIFVVRALEQHVEDWYVIQCTGVQHFQGNTENLRTAVAEWARSVDPRPVLVGAQRRPDS